MNDQSIDLKQAVQEQLDLILKMEEDRKSLKKQNKLLTQKLKSLNSIVEKYQVETADDCTNTENFDGGDVHKEVKVLCCDEGVQVEIQEKVNNTEILNVLNNSKLIQAQSLLKSFDSLKINEQSRVEQEPKGFKKDKHRKKSPEQVATKPQNEPSSKRLNDQIIKMSKQINALKRQVKQAEHRNSLKDKQLKQVKKCLENKSEALEKSRKQFNELSNLYNTDKYKSLRNLETEVKTLRAKLCQKEQQSKQVSKLKSLKNALSEVTQEYEEYREQMEKKVEILIAELAVKQKQNQNLQIEQKKLLRKLEFSATQN